MEDQYPGNACFILGSEITGSLHSFVLPLDPVHELWEDLSSGAYRFWRIRAGAASLVSDTAGRNSTDIPFGQFIQSCGSQGEHRIFLSPEPVLEACQG